MAPPPGGYKNQRSSQPWCPPAPPDTAMERLIHTYRQTPPWQCKLLCNFCPKKCVNLADHSGYWHTCGRAVDHGQHPGILPIHHLELWSYYTIGAFLTANEVAAFGVTSTKSVPRVTKRPDPPSSLSLQAIHRNEHPIIISDTEEPPSPSPTRSQSTDICESPNDSPASLVLSIQDDGPPRSRWRESRQWAASGGRQGFNDRQLASPRHDGPSAGPEASERHEDPAEPTAETSDSSDSPTDSLNNLYGDGPPPEENAN
jgi:hypothetical protein